MDWHRGSRGRVAVTVLGRIVGAILDRRETSSYDMGITRHALGGTGDHSGINKQRRGITKTPTYLTIHRDIGLVKGATPTERVVVTLANFFGAVESDTEGMIWWLLFSLVPEVEREEKIMEVLGEHVGIEEVRSRIPKERREKIDNLQLELFDALARTSVKPVTPRRKMVNDRLALLRRRLVERMIARIEWNVRDGELFVEWTDEARVWLRQARIEDVDDSEMGIRLDQRGLLIRETRRAS